MQSVFCRTKGPHSTEPPRRRAASAGVVALSFVAISALSVGCAIESNEPEATRDASTATGEPELIGGHPARADDFRSTVAIDGTCTAAKVGARLFLTAAHCVAVPRPLRGMPPPEDYPPNGGVADHYLAGKSLSIDWGLKAADLQRADFTIVKTAIHPSWWTCPLCASPILDSGAADVAVVEVAEDTPQIPEARVELANIPTGAHVVKVGWGCEERTNVDPMTVELTNYKLADASTILASEIRKYDTRITDEQVASVDATYLVTAGHDQAPESASLCLGDSGGPLYLPSASDRRIVGVNSDYTFRPPEAEGDLGGVSWTDWHTRTSLDSGQGVGQWLTDLNVNTVHGD